jgi:hypothetical protein
VNGVWQCLWHCAWQCVWHCVWRGCVRGCVCGVWQCVWLCVWQCVYRPMAPFPLFPLSNCQGNLRFRVCVCLRDLRPLSPPSASVRVVVVCVPQEACNDLLTAERDLLAQLTASKRTVQTAEVMASRAGLAPLTAKKSFRSSTLPGPRRNQFAPVFAADAAEGKTDVAGSDGEDPYGLAAAGAASPVLGAASPVLRSGSGSGGGSGGQGRSPLVRTPSNGSLRGSPRQVSSQRPRYDFSSSGNDDASLHSSPV